MIRKAIYATDLIQTYELVNKAYKIERCYPPIGFKKVSSSRWPQEIDSEYIKEQFNNTYVFLLEECIVGCVVAVVSNGVTHIGPLAVHPDNRGMGIGRKLLDFAESLAEITELETLSYRTDLLYLYQKRGYYEVARHPCTDYINESALTKENIITIFMRKYNKI